MTLASMTGFARAAGALGAWRWTVELKCVNAKGLDLRLRAAARASTASRRRRARGSPRRWRAGRVSPPSTRSARAPASTARIDTALLAEIAAAARAAAREIRPRAADARRRCSPCAAWSRSVEAERRRGDDGRRRRRHAGEPRRGRSPRWSQARRAEGAALQQGAGRAARRHRRADPGRRRQSGAQARGGARAARRKRRRAAGVARAARRERGCIRRRSCSPPRPTSARSSTG